MLDQIDAIAFKTGVAPETTRKAVAIILSLIKTQGDQNKVVELFQSLHGADILAAEGSAGGGLLAKMAGGMMGGPLAAITRMQSLGVSHQQSKDVYSEVITIMRKQAGASLLRSAAGNIPGLSGYL
jgi:hypothetical protein